MKTIFYAADTNNGCLVTDHEYDNEYSAFLAAISNGNATFERNDDGYMQAMEDGRHVYFGGSYNDDDDYAIAEAGEDLYKWMRQHSYNENLTSLEVQYANDGSIIKIAGSSNKELIAYWAEII
jgi:hypothetical protein